jgi:competence protein ComEC
VAHHGSDDPGLPAQLETTDPGLAVISAGEDNPFGHPTPATLAAIADSGATALRTDRSGTISIVVGRNGYEVETGR